jgi:hypothetical protein
MNRKANYRGKAEYFAVYSPDTRKVYMVAVNEAPNHSMILRFKNAGVVRSNVKYWWAEDFEI